MSELAPFYAMVEIWQNGEYLHRVSRKITHKNGIPYARYQYKKHELTGRIDGNSVHYCIEQEEK